MRPERRQRLEEIFQQAMELAGDARATFLDEACKADLSLRREAESLLVQATNDAIKAQLAQILS
jgi:hypothetical protein